MKVQRYPVLLPLAVLPMTPLLTGCEIVGRIFKAGVWVGGLGVFAVIALIIWGIKSVLS